MIRSMQNKVDSYKALVAGMGAYMDSQVWRSIERSMNLVSHCKPEQILRIVKSDIKDGKDRLQ